MVAITIVLSAETNLQPGTNILFIHALHLCFIMKLIHHAVHQIHQGLH